MFKPAVLLCICAILLLLNLSRIEHERTVEKTPFESMEIAEIAAYCSMIPKMSLGVNGGGSSNHYFAIYKSWLPVPDDYDTAAFKERFYSNIEDALSNKGIQFERSPDPDFGVDYRCEKCADFYLLATVTKAGELLLVYKTPN